MLQTIIVTKMVPDKAAVFGLMRHLLDFHTLHFQVKKSSKVKMRFFKIYRNHLNRNDMEIYTLFKIQQNWIFSFKKFRESLGEVLYF